MSEIVQADGVGLLAAREAVRGTLAAAGWRTLQPNPDGITSFTRQNTVVERRILSPNLTPERGDVVGYDVGPQIAVDMTMDLWRLFAEPIARSVTKASGGTGVCEFAPSAVTTTAFTVASGGAIAAGILVRADGFANAANNGNHVVAASSTGTSIKVAETMVAEASPPANAIVRVIGVQGASGDITEDASGNLLSTVLDFTTLGLNVGQKIYVGDVTSGAAFAFASGSGDGVVSAVSAHQLSVVRPSYPVGVDAGTGKTIRILFEGWLRNVPMTSADYLRPTVSLELVEPGAGTSAATDYTDSYGNAVASCDLNVPVQGKVTATIKFTGMKTNEPGPAQAAGASTALAPLLASLFSTGSELYDVRVINLADGSAVAADFNSSKIMLSNTVSPLKALGVSGAADLIFGEYVPTLSFTAYEKDNNLTRAIDTNADVAVEYLFRNGDGGIGFSFPMCKVRKGDKKFSAGQAVTQDVDVVPNRDPSTGILYSISLFGYLP